MTNANYGPEISSLADDMVMGEIYEGLTPGGLTDTRAWLAALLIYFSYHEIVWA